MKCVQEHSSPVNVHTTPQVPVAASGVAGRALGAGIQSTSHEQSTRAALCCVAIHKRTRGLKIDLPSKTHSDRLVLIAQALPHNAQHGNSMGLYL